MKNKKIILNNTSFEKFFSVLLLALPTLIFRLNLDNDFWFLLSHGRNVVTEGIPFIEPLTLHENFDFVMQQWLFSLGSWLLYSKTGEIGTLIVLFLISLVICALSFKLALICSDNAYKISSLVTVVSQIGLYMFFIKTRPQVITYVLLLLEFLALELYFKSSKFKYLLLLPVISVVQINNQASMWGILFVFALPFIVNSFKFELFGFKSEGCKKTPLFISLIVMFLCGFINPYGIKAMTYILSSYGVKYIDAFVGEMAIISIKNPVGIVFYAILFGFILLLKFNKQGKAKLRYELLFYGSIILTLLSQKSLSFFLFASIPFFASYCSNLESKVIVLTENEKKNKKNKIILTLLMTIIIVSSLIVKINSYSPEDTYISGTKAIDYISEQNDSDEQLVVYTGYDLGGYAEFKGFKPYIDARAEVFLKDNNNQKDVFIEYLEMLSGKRYYKDVLNQYNFDYLITTKSESLYYYLDRDNDYEVIYEDENSRIYKPISKER